MKTTLTDSDLAPVLDRLATANAEFARRYPGESSARQPVHTVYGGAHLFRSDSAGKLGQLAMRSLHTYAPDAQTLARAVGLSLSDSLIETIYTRVVDKLQREPIEDFRIDFEDGYGNRPDEEEDACAEAAAQQVVKGMQTGSLPPFIGIRIKPLTAELHRRSLRTLDIFLSTVVHESGGQIPDGFVITVPKVVDAEQVRAATAVFDRFEQATSLPTGSLKMELMIETTQSIIGPDGTSALVRFAEAAEGRCTGAHFGVYDYTAGCTITASHQSMQHPACDFARHMMQVAFGGTGVMISDGATNTMPVGPHQATADQPLTKAQIAENQETVHRAWRLHYEDVQHSLRHAFYQGWDLHPAQLPTRYAALYAFFLGGLEAASERLRNFVDKAAQATLSGDIFDDAATGQGLLNFFLRGLNCGAITEDEAHATGLSVDELRTRSFVKILEGRRRGSA